MDLRCHWIVVVMACVDWGSTFFLSIFNVPAYSSEAGKAPRLLAAGSQDLFRLSQWEVPQQEQIILLLPFLAITVVERGIGLFYHSISIVPQLLITSFRGVKGRCVGVKGVGFDGLDWNEYVLVLKPPAVAVAPWSWQWRCVLEACNFLTVEEATASWWSSPVVWLWELSLKLNLKLFLQPFQWSLSHLIPHNKSLFLLKLAWVDLTLSKWTLTNIEMKGIIIIYMQKLNGWEYNTVNQYNGQNDSWAYLKEMDLTLWFRWILCVYCNLMNSKEKTRYCMQIEHCLK